MNKYEIFIKMRNIIIDIAAIIYANQLCNESLLQGHQPLLLVAGFVLTLLALPFLLINLLILGHHFLPRLRSLGIQFINEE